MNAPACGVSPWRKKKLFTAASGAWPNGNKVRTQCHLNHIGKWVPAARLQISALMKRVEDLPAPEHGGVLLSVPDGFIVLTGEQTMETALVR